MGQIVLVTGGARSGKSVFAEELAKAQGGPVVYVATAEACDDEMTDRIARHKAQRPAEWKTIESPQDLHAPLRELEAGTRAVLIECLSLWTANRMAALGDSEEEAGWWAEADALEAALKSELESLFATARSADWLLILVTNEVGMGLHPNSALGRAYQDMLGRLNQFTAARADAVYLVVSGMALNIKNLAVSRPVKEEGLS